MWRVEHKLFLSWWAFCSSIKIMQYFLENTRFKITPVSVRCLNEFGKSYTITYTILLTKIGPAPIKHRYIVPPVWPSLPLTVMNGQSMHNASAFNCHARLLSRSRYKSAGLWWIELSDVGPAAWLPPLVTTYKPQPPPSAQFYHGHIYHLITTITQTSVWGRHTKHNSYF